MRGAVVLDSSALPTQEQSWLGNELTPFAGKYVVQRILGQGGMGTVFEARHVRLEQRVAIKVLGSALREHPELVERFEREARACGSLSSAHAVRIIDIDATEDGTPFIVMELLEGRDLAQIIESEGPQPVSRAVRWVTEACDAIAEAHRLGIIHRDLKPSNLFLARSEGRAVVKVLDFGIAKRVASTDAAITQALSPLGTPQYMSPEQVRAAKDVDVRTDVWSLGVSLYELVCGQTPFCDESASACIAAIAADPVPDPRTLRPDLDAAFVAVLLRALAKNAAERYQTIDDLVAALAPFASAFEDQEMVSTVRRALGSRPALAAITPLAQAESYAVETFAARAPLESRSDRTVPPSISLLSEERVPMRRFRPSIVIAVAAAMGLVLLAAIGQLTAGGVAASAPTLQRVEAADLQASPSAVALPAAVMVGSEPLAAEVEVAPVTEVAQAAVPVAAPSIMGVVAKPLVARPLVPALAGSANDARLVVASARAKSDRPAPQVTASRGVHGGITNPGF